MRVVVCNPPRCKSFPDLKGVFLCGAFVRFNIGEFTTDANGTFKLIAADVGWYRIREIQAPAGYILKTETKDIFMAAGETYSLIFDKV